ncbi:hypothetical protein KO566_05240 [Flavobacteriaceae bacterium XHP0103]|uniref:Piwi domain-containing protein n=1 Tax=Marixanthotalea marina TaxID=2844359 RepID=UPI002989BC6E|nr:Piwi domain-containing protein [Marixanthotalea marina]MBU3821456.1 hypothetical protein [Marixanthotalea marina]
MSQNLFFNILTFDVPSVPITFYFSKKKIGNAQELYKNKFPKNIEELFPGITTENPDFIYTSFIYEKEGYLPFEVVLSEESIDLVKHYYNWRIKNYFKNLKKLVKSNFIEDNQIWLRDVKYNNKTFAQYDKFTLKVQFNEVSDYGELIIAYDGVTKNLKKPISQLVDEVSPALFTGVIHNRKFYKYEKIQDKIDDFSKTHAVFNNKIRAALGYEVENNLKKNKYIDYKAKIEGFINKFLVSKEFKNVVAVNNDDFLPVEKKRVGYVADECNDLVFKNGVGRIPKTDFHKLKPYSSTPHKAIHLFFILHSSFVEEVKKLESYFKNGTGFYKGLQQYAGILYHVEKGFSIVYDDLENPLPQIKQGIKDLDIKPEVTYIAVYLSPFGKHDQNLKNREVYYKVKEQLLLRRIVSQVIDFNRYKKNINSFVFDLTNISLALLAKLEGIPWQLNVSNKKELVIGVGAFKNVIENVQYVASAFSFQNNGKFNGFQYDTKSNTSELAGAISDAIYKFVNIEQNPDKVVVHFYKEMSDKELAPIVEMMDSLNIGCPLFIVTINKTRSKDIIAFDEDWHNRLMPKSGTFINISKKEHKYLLFNNSRYSNEPTFPSSESYPFPIKLKITSPTPKALEDTQMIKKLIEQVYQFSRLYWKSLRQQNVPITIKYPEMVAEIAPNFDNKEIPPYGKEILWFL